MWKRITLFVLQARPRGWARARMWALLSVVLLVTWYATGMSFDTSPGMPSGAGFFFDYFRQPDGSWKVGKHTHSPNDLVVRFEGAFRHEAGSGWEKWTATPAVASVLSTTPPLGSRTPVPSSLLNQSQIDDARRVGFQQIIDNLDPSLDQRTNSVGCALLRDGRIREVHGVAVYYARIAAGTVAIPLLVIALAVGTLRTRRRERYERRLSLNKQNLCPACKYPLGAGPTRVCPECGLDAAKDATQALAELGRG